MAGNSNSGRRAEKPFADALRMELAAAGPDHKKLREIAKKLIDKAAEGDMQALTALMDRVDGKPAQQVIHAGDEEGGPIEANVTHNGQIALSGTAAFVAEALGMGADAAPQEPGQD